MSDVNISFSTELNNFIYTLLALFIIGFVILTFGVIKMHKKFILAGIIISIITSLIGIISYYL